MNVKITRYPRVQYLTDAADRYASAAMRVPVSLHTATMLHADRDRGTAIGRAYLDAPTFDPAAISAYLAFAREVTQQWLYLTGPLGVRVDVTADDPYATAEEMAADLRDNRHLSVLSTATTGGHPFLSNGENDAFRAVHDAFGHAAVGRGFDRHSEEAAWFAHSHLFSPLARRALTTETRGQNSAFTWINNGSEFPEQKVILLPREYVSLTPVSTYHNTPRNGV